MRIAIATVVLLLLSACATDPTPQPSLSKRIATLTKKLGAEDFNTRQTAGKALLELAQVVEEVSGVLTRPHVKAVDEALLNLSKNSDPEIAVRATDILTKLRSNSGSIGHVLVGNADYNYAELYMDEIAREKVTVGMKLFFIHAGETGGRLRITKIHKKYVVAEWLRQNSSEACLQEGDYVTHDPE
jgi:hypothetical protein